jgi:hypothetical protein
MIQTCNRTSAYRKELSYNSENKEYARQHMSTTKIRTGGLVAVVLLLVIAGGAYFFLQQTPATTTPPTSFNECVAAGNAVMESYPRQCTAKDGSHFTEDIGNELEKADLIRVDSPRPNTSIKSPLTITGQARGNWFFEASFPIFLTDWNGKIIAQGIATAEGDWMTTDFVPFKATLTFDTGDISGHYSNRGTLILKKDNPSGLPENDDALEYQVEFAGVSAPPVATGR